MSVSFSGAGDLALNTVCINSSSQKSLRMVLPTVLIILRMNMEFGEGNGASDCGSLVLMVIPLYVFSYVR